MTPIRAVDLFAGAGGASTGLMLASERLGLDLHLTAINHWPAAVRTHEANHPAASHLCQSIESVDPRAVVPGGRLQLLVAGPECTHHSTARGGKPINDQSRASAWHLLRWCELLHVEHVIIENVPEFRTWGPLGSNNRPLKRRKGETYRAFLAALASLNYRVEERILNSADYGEATTRKRLFIQASRGGRAIVWPEPTHSRSGRTTLLRSAHPWRPAREVIDWTLASESIFTRKKPLSPNTLRRIEAGLKRFGGRPFVLGQHGGSVPRLTTEPLPTVTADVAISCVEPFVLQITHGGREHAVSKPLPTITGGQRGDLALVEPFVVSLRGTAPDQLQRSAKSLDDPLATVSAGGTHHALVEPFTMPYCSNGGQLARPVSQPIGTITTRDRFALVIPDGMDVRFRMLQLHELAEAMGFPKGYQFVGTKTDAIRMVGNAWSVRVARALCEAALGRFVSTVTPERRRAC